MCDERDVHLQIKDNRARTGERFVAAGDALHPDGECAISSPTVILKWKKIHIIEGKKTKNTSKRFKQVYDDGLSLCCVVGRADPSMRNCRTMKK